MMAPRAQLALAAISVTGLLVGAGPVSAGERSVGLYSAALVEFHSGRYEAALDLLDQALGADPEYADALYYRGVCHNRLGQHEAAAADLRRVLARKPNLTAAALELGQALYGLEQYEQARSWLGRAAEVPLFAGRANLYLGLVDLSAERYQSADAHFERAAQAQPALRASARYYQGVARFEADDREAAEQAFNEVVALDPSLAVATQSVAFLKRLREGVRRNYGFFGSAGFDYDSNVRLEPDQTGFVNAGDPADGRSVLTLGGWYVPVKNELLELSLGYGFFQSLHFDLSANNIQGHRASAGISSNFGRVQYGLTGRFDYFLSWLEFTPQGNETGAPTSFSVDGRIQPWLSVPNALGETEVFYRFRVRDFFFDEISPTQDGNNNAVGVRQYYPVGNRGFIVSGLRFDQEDKTGEAGAPFQYDGYALEAGIGWQLPLAVYANAQYAYTKELYGQASRLDPTSVRRRDDEHDFSIVLRRPLGKQVSVVGGYYGKIHNSTQALFQYARHIGSISLQLSY